ncbi:hypothetical protein VTL71DRAFT_10540 [Oculimacula yallundae]|uniref:Protein kinase domain-containing protein n=1 Tax=Oculimacula yallundae TaxID=86028 RepID=A0ABR4CVL0_9HELO
MMDLNCSVAACLLALRTRFKKGEKSAYVLLVQIQASDYTSFRRLVTANDQTSAKHLSVSCFDGFSAYIGTFPLTKKRKYTLGSHTNISKFNHIFEDLRRLTDSHLYPVYQPHFTQFTTVDIDTCIWDNNRYFFKAPNLSGYSGDDSIARLTLEEVEINEKLMRHPHPNLAVYLGCVVRNGFIVHLAFRKYYQILFSRVWASNGAIEFPAERRLECMDGVKLAAKHLHQLGIAHNDISPGNIMFDGDDVPILIDLDSCAPIESRIKKGGGGGCSWLERSHA